MTMELHKIKCDYNDKRLKRLVRNYLTVNGLPRGMKRLILSVISFLVLLMQKKIQEKQQQIRNIGAHF